jgi:hypothetical protein
MKRNKRAGVAGGKRKGQGEFLAKRPSPSSRTEWRGRLTRRPVGGELADALGHGGGLEVGGNREVAKGVLLPSSPWVGTVGGGGSMGGDRL